MIAVIGKEIDLSNYIMITVNGFANVRCNKCATKMDQFIEGDTAQAVTFEYLFYMIENHETKAHS